MTVEFTPEEVNEILELISQAWIDGFESGQLESIYSKLGGES